MSEHSVLLAVQRQVEGLVAERNALRAELEAERQHHSIERIETLEATITAAVLILARARTTRPGSAEDRYLRAITSAEDLLRDSQRNQEDETS